jgi:hypothetical protein
LFQANGARPTVYAADRPTTHSCATVCKACGDACESHADQHDHCRVCAEACHRCEQARNDVITALG